VFTSDNGGLSVREGPDTPAASNAPRREGKGYLYEGGIREPFLVKWPSVTKAGGIRAVPVCGIDLFPTILDVCGVKHKGRVDGRSLVPLLKGGELKRDALFSRYHFWHCNQRRPFRRVWTGEDLHASRCR
jgi:arylsulfatase A-like enzyme